MEKPTAGALRAQDAIRKLLASAYLYPEHTDFGGTVAHVIDRETGVAELLDSAKAVLHFFVYLDSAGGEGARDTLTRLRGAVAKAERSE